MTQGQEKEAKSSQENPGAKKGSKGGFQGQVDPQRFLGAILKSGLVPRESLKKHLESAPKSALNSTEALADCLVEAGALSRFQAGKLRLGISRGLKLGHYSVISPVAKGGMATVYLGQDTRDKRIVALKVLPPNQAKESRHLARFQREARLNRLVRHPGLCGFLDEGVCDEVNYLVMEFIPGQSLHRTVSESGPLPVEKVAKLGAEVAYALDALHKAGLVHRDLKPSNILITPTGNARLIDLGLAFQPGETGEGVEVVGGLGYIVGSMDFIAPEQTKDPTNVDGRADLYSLGCSLYFAATGKPPFEGGSNKERMRRHREEVAVPLQQVLPHAPARFCALVHLLMEKDPAERFGSAGTVAADLQLLVPENQALFSLDMDGESVAATLENLRVYNPREKTELESQLLRDTGTEFTPLENDPLPEMGGNWADSTTVERKALPYPPPSRGNSPAPEVPLFLNNAPLEKAVPGEPSDHSGHRANLWKMWGELPSWERWLIIAFAGIWTICLVLAGILIGIGWIGG